MTSFNDIYSNAVGYRNDFNELASLIEALSNEKAKSNPLVRWFRLRHRMVSQTLEPLINLLSNMNEENGNDLLIHEIPQAIGVIEDRDLDATKAHLRRISELYGTTIEITSGNWNETIELLETMLEGNRSSSLETEDRTHAIELAKHTINEFEGTPHAKDIDIDEFTKLINANNDNIRAYDVDVPELEQLPTVADKSVIEDLSVRIRSVIDRIDSRYAMGIFEDAKQVNRTIIHDLSNNRGSRAFTNRAASIFQLANIAIDTFNGKYWQITGMRWERTGTGNKHGYRSVKPTHEKIKSI